MSLPACVLQWPQEVSGQVMRALFAPAQDMHPQQAREQVPKVLWDLPAHRLSQGLQPRLNDWPAELDGRRIEHRLALLPRSVIEAIAWNLGLLACAASLRRRVLRSEVQLLAEHGLQEGDWALALSAPRNGAPQADPLADHPLQEWPSRMGQLGQAMLANLCAQLGPVLGARLRCKLATGAESAAETKLPAPAGLLALAYPAPVRAWSPDWDDCLAQLEPGTH